MSIRATNSMGEYVGDVTISKEENADGSRNAYKAGTSHESLTPIGTIHKTDRNWQATAPDGSSVIADSRTKAAGYLIAHASHAQRVARLRAAKDRTQKIAEDVLAEYPEGPEHDLAALFQSIDPVIHGIDAGYNPKGRDVIVAGTDGFLHRGTLTGVIVPATETHYERYEVILPDGTTSTVAWGLVIPQEILDQEWAVSITEVERETAEAIVRVTKFLDVYQSQRNADPEVVYSLPRTADRDGLDMNELRVDDLRALVSAAQQETP